MFLDGRSSYSLALHRVVREVGELELTTIIFHSVDDCFLISSLIGFDTALFHDPRCPYHLVFARAGRYGSSDCFR